MKTFQSLSLTILALICLNSAGQEASFAGIDYLENEILGKLNDKTWDFWFIKEYIPAGKSIYQLELKDNITISNHRLNFVTKKGTKSVSVTYGSVMPGTVSASREIRLHLGDSLIIAKRTSTESSGSAMTGAVIENNNQKVRDLISLFKAYQSYPLTEIYKQDLLEFRILADEYGKTVTKPAMTEEQRRLIVQANALNDKQSYSGALEKYKQATELNPISYPQAYYNMALIAAQKEEYRYAILNMKKYLLLVPDAEDTRAAQDKIYEWEIDLEK